MSNEQVFSGFESPQENWSKLPHALIEALPLITSQAELKVILYILRHTWGYHDNEKRITLDEFANGRKRRDGSRIDGGTGMSKNAIRDGIERATDHGFIEVDVDARDLGRIEKTYRLVQKVSAGVQKLNPALPKVEPRTEKDTSETNLLKNGADAPPDDLDEILGTTKPETQPRQPRTADDIRAGVKQALIDYAAREEGEPWRYWGHGCKWIDKLASNDPPRDGLLELGYLLGEWDGRRPIWSDKTSVDTWTAGLVKLYRACGGDFNLVKRAVAQMRADCLTRHDPYSYIATVESLRADVELQDTHQAQQAAAWSPTGLPARVTIPPGLDAADVGLWQGTIAKLANKPLARWAWDRVRLARRNGGADAWILITPDAATAQRCRDHLVDLLRPLLPEALPLEVM